MTTAATSRSGPAVPSAHPRLRPPPRDPRRWTQRTARLSGLLLRTVFTATALFGLLVTPLTAVLLLVPALALGAAGLAAGFVWYVQQHWPTRAALTATARNTAAVVPFSEGVQALRGVGTAIVVVVLSLLIVVLVSWTSRLSGAAPRSPAPGTSARSDESLRDLLHVVPLETVFDEWRAVQDLPGQRADEAERRAAIRTRTLLLDEMQRRDPTGFATWLAGGASAPPEQHVRDGRGLAA